MKLKTSLALVALLFFIGLVNTQRPLQERGIDAPAPRPAFRIEQTNAQDVVEDPLMKKTPAENSKRRHPRQGDENGLPRDVDAQTEWKTYKPFDYEEKAEEEKKEEQENDVNEFNELLKWGMLGGSAFLIFVLIKSCTQKRGRRQMRRVALQTQQRRQMLNQPVAGGFYYCQPIQQPFVNINQQQPQEQAALDERILHAENELTKLKELKQQALRQEFNRKKMEEEQQKNQMIIAQRRQNLQHQQRQNNWNFGYGPVFYGQQNIVYAQPQPQQPFQVKGIQPIRQRSNSYKTEMSEQPILQNEVRYRNGIPIGKPVRPNDNDSSFASEYPEV